MWQKMLQVGSGGSNNIVSNNIWKRIETNQAVLCEKGAYYIILENHSFDTKPIFTNSDVICMQQESGGGRYATATLIRTTSTTFTSTLSSLACELKLE